MSHAITDVAPRPAGPLMGLIIALTAFLTLVDLFAIQAILPSLAKRYGVSAAEIGAAANACTLGMAVSSLLTALASPFVARRSGVALSLALLALPTAALAFVDNLAVFTVLRIVQGCLMAAAFTLMLAYLGEHFMGSEAAPAFAAFITGNVLSNLAGRMLSASVADHLGLASTFLVFAGLNLAGAGLVLATLARGEVQRRRLGDLGAIFRPVAMHLRERELRRAFLVGFLILFVFIGVFTYVNFVLVAPPLGLAMSLLGLVYLVFLPSLPTTLLAGRLALAMGAREAMLLVLALALAGLPLLATGNLALVLLGLALVAVGTFAAQAIATGFVGRAATSERGAASGLYLASYFAGGLVGSIVLGLIFERFGWPATLGAIGAAIAWAMLLAARHRPSLPVL